ncbi:glycoside hydrolase family 43 protein [Streptomyces sp. NPDC096311]|uniref:glycoside hydrolase family 43 protein n=1 Tax=Streptomyces sp. NPDC096311 TaxID=3366083 RepID=UPI0037FA5ED6
MAQPSPRTNAPSETRYAGYLLVYFAGDDTPDGEQIRFALSHGNDPLRWHELNRGRPVITSAFGTGGLRDPFVVRSPLGTGFHLLATDLRMYPRHADGDAWERAQRHGSRHIAVWDSADLVTWTGGRLAEVAPRTAGNAWAPKAHGDDESGMYVIYWASRLWPETDAERTGLAHNVMLWAPTADFRTFGPAQVWYDPGHDVIDAAVIRHDGVYHRFVKDERPSGVDAPDTQLIAAQRSHRWCAAPYEPVSAGIGADVIERGEGPAVFKSNTEDKWYLFIDEFGGRGYVPFETEDLDSGRWRPCSDYALPRTPRHGCVLPITKAEHDRLTGAYGTEADGADLAVRTRP